MVPVAREALDGHGGRGQAWVYQGLRSLPWRVYLAAMWILCGELRTLYAPWTHEDELPLIAVSMDLVRDVVVGGDGRDGAARSGTGAHPGTGVPEAGGRASLREAAECLGHLRRPGLGDRRPVRPVLGSQWVMRAATERWRDWDRPGPIIVNWEQAEEVVSD